MFVVIAIGIVIVILIVILVVIVVVIFVVLTASSRSLAQAVHFHLTSFSAMQPRDGVQWGTARRIP